jgi:hypothetical protein
MGSRRQGTVPPTLTSTTIVAARTCADAMRRVDRALAISVGLLPV